MRLRSVGIAAGTTLFSIVAASLFILSVQSAAVSLPIRARHFDQAPGCGRLAGIGVSTSTNRISSCTYHSGRAIQVMDLISKTAVYVVVRRADGRNDAINLERDSNAVPDVLYFLHPRARPIVRLHDRVTMQSWGDVETGGFIDGHYYVTSDNPDYEARTAWFSSALTGLVALAGNILTILAIRDLRRSPFRGTTAPA